MGVGLRLWARWCVWMQGSGGGESELACTQNYKLGSSKRDKEHHLCGRERLSWRAGSLYAPKRVANLFLVPPETHTGLFYRFLEGPETSLITQQGAA